MTNFDDEETDRYDPFALVIRNGIVEEVGIFNSENLEEFTLGKIEGIEDTRLVKYSISEPGFFKKVSPYVVFGLVRDYYHEHIYAHYADRLLSPVRSDSKEEAVNLIKNQYEEKIISYHKFIKEQLEGVSQGRESFTYRELADIRHEIGNAKGEMIHALSFAELFCLEPRTKEAIRNSLDSFENLMRLSDFYVMERGTLINFSVFFLTFIATCTAVFFSLGKFMGKVQAFLGAILFAGVFMFLLIPFYNWHTRKKAPHRNHS
jgi:hypothetical protein